MGSYEENLARYQEIADRGIQDRLSPDKKARFDEAVNRGLIKVADIPIEESIDAPQLEMPPQQQERGMGGELQGAVDFAQQLPGAAIGAADVAGGAIYGLGKQAVEGVAELGALATGRGVDESIEYGQRQAGKLPDYDVGQRGQDLIASLSEKYQIMPDVIKNLVSDIGSAGQDFGDQVYDATGSRSGATFARMLPEVGEAVMGGLVGKRVAKNVGEEVIDNVRRQSPDKQQMARRIQAGSVDNELAPFATDTPINQKPQLPVPPQAAPGVQAAPSGQVLKQADVSPQPRLISNPKAANAVNKGVSEGLVANLNQASDRTKKKVLQMINITKRGKGNATYRAQNNPNKVAGNTLLERFKYLNKVRKDAGQDISDIADGLKGKRLKRSDLAPIKDSVYGVLDDLDIRLDHETGAIDFSDSVIRQNAAGRKAIKQLLDANREILAGNVPDGYQLHKAKRMLDKAINQGKQMTGLDADVQGQLRDVRASINDVLKDNYSDYRRANEIYAETVDPINNLQKLSGSSFDLDGPGAADKLGTLSRRITSNAASRAELINVANKMDSLAKKHGANFNDDLYTQVAAANELEKLFGAPSDTSLKGIMDSTAAKSAEVGMDVKTGGASAVGRKVMDKAKKIFSPSEQEQLDALIELLSK